MGGTGGWCDSVERGMARRRIKGLGEDSKRTWQQEGRLSGEEEGRQEKAGP